MKNKICKKVLLIGGLLFLINPNLWSNNHISTNLIDQDKFVFKVAGQVFSLQDLHAYYKSMKVIGCYDRQSLSSSFFANELKEENDSFYNQGSFDFSEGQKVYFQKLLSFAKLLMYSKSFEQSASLTGFEKGLRGHKCLNGNDIKSLIIYLKEVKALNTFLSSRFLPKKDDYKLTAQDLLKAKSGVQNLINSIQKQIDQEVYW